MKNIFYILIFFILYCFLFIFLFYFPYFFPFSISGPRCIMLLKINPYNSNFFYSIIQYPCAHPSPPSQAFGRVAGKEDESHLS